MVQTKSIMLCFDNKEKFQEVKKSFGALMPQGTRFVFGRTNKFGYTNSHKIIIPRSSVMWEGAIAIAENLRNNGYCFYLATTIRTI